CRGGLGAYGEPTALTGASADAGGAAATDHAAKSNAGYRDNPVARHDRSQQDKEAIADLGLTQMGMNSMKQFLMIAISAAVAAAQQPTPPAPPTPAALPPVAATPARDTSVIPLDRIVAIVGDQPITQFDVEERMLAMRQQPGFKAPTTEAEYNKLAFDLVNQLIDEELLVQKAKQLKVEIQDRDLSTQVDRQVRDIRSRFSSDVEFRSELAKAGLGTPEEYRRFLTEQLRRGELQRRVIEKMRQDGKIPPVNVSQAEVEEAFNRSRTVLPRR